MKISNIILIIVVVIIIVAIGGYFGARYYLSAQGPEYLLMHPTMAKIFGASAICPMICPQGGVCGKDGKNYCNQCIAFQHGAGYAHDGVCVPTGWNTYDNFGIEFQYPSSWGNPQESISASSQQVNFIIGPSVSPFSASIQSFLNPATGQTETLDQMMSRYLANNKNISSINDISANGIKGKEILTNSAVNGQPYFFEAIFPLNSQSYMDFSGDITSISQNTFDKIISTFKLNNSSVVKTDSATGMLIYKNTDMTFEYPAKFNSDYISLNLQTMILNSSDKNIDSNGCYVVISGNGKSGPGSFITVNNIKFCLSEGSDVGAGQAYNSYYYTTLNNGKYYVVEYLVHSPNACGGYENSPDVNAPGNERYKACMADESNWNSIVTKPIQDSVATFKFN